jgi:hypothetical protein
VTDYRDGRCTMVKILRDPGHSERKKSSHMIILSSLGTRQVTTNIQYDGDVKIDLIVTIACIQKSHNNNNNDSRSTCAPKFAHPSCQMPRFAVALYNAREMNMGEMQNLITIKERGNTITQRQPSC